MRFGTEEVLSAMQEMIGEAKKERGLGLSKVVSERARLAWTTRARLACCLHPQISALFSIIDHCDILSQILTFHISEKVTAIPVQHPLKWQPHEIDGFYVSENPRVLYPVEAKALSTHDQINLYQMRGELETMRMNYRKIPICPIGCQMLNDGMRFAIFPTIGSQEEVPIDLTPENYIKVVLKPEIKAWSKKPTKKKKHAAQTDNRELDNFIK
jgi:hypothetical protein